MLYAWGQNGFGQLGNGTTSDALTPASVMSPPGATFSSLSSDSSSSHSLAIAVPTQTTTTTTLSPSIASPSYGQSDTLTAKVAASDGGGTVSFADGSNTIAGCAGQALTLVGSVEQATCTVTGLVAGQHNLSAAYSGDTGSSPSASSTVAMTVQVAPLVITGSSAAVTYGTAPAPVDPAFSGFVNGDSASSLTSQPTCATSATASSPAGSYPTTCSGAASSNYAITYASGQVVVAPAPLSVSASSGTLTYGGTVPDITPSYAGFVNGDTPASLTPQPTCSTTATSSSGVGSYPSTCSGASDPNYTISYSDGQVSVGQAPLLVTASSLATTYGSAPTAITPSYSGFLNGDTPASLTTQASCSTGATATSAVGTYPSSCSGAADSNYAISYVDGAVTVTPAPVTITASSSSMTYGGTVPDVSPTIDGLQNGEGASELGGGLTCTTTASSTTPVGTYGATCSGAVDPNYAFTYVDGSTTVTPAPVTISASSGTMIYGGDVPAITPTVDGLQNGEGASVLGSALACSTTATTTSPVASYPSTCSGASDPNYEVSFVRGSIDVTPAPVTVTASSASVTYGDPSPSITPTVDGLQNGEGPSVLGAGLLCGTSGVGGSPVGTYVSVCSGAVDGNYTVTYVEGTVVVAPAPLTITASSAAVTYGDAAAGRQRLLCRPGQRRHFHIAGDGSDVLHDGRGVEPVRHLREHLLGRGRHQLHHRLRGRNRGDRSGGPGRRGLVGHDDLRRWTAGHHPDLRGTEQWRHRRLVGDGPDVHDLGHILEPGRHLRHHVLGCGRRQLLDHLRGRDGVGGPGPAQRHGLVGIAALRRGATAHHADLRRLRQR